jgi:transposase InsO family protein
MAVGKRYTPSQRAAAVEQATAEGVAAAARATGASQQSVVRWRRAAQRAAGETVERGWEQSNLEKQRDLEVLHEWHKQPGLGPSQIRNQLRRRGIRTSVHTVRRVMEDHGYRPPKVKSQAHHERYEAVRPGAMWHLDFLHRHIHQAPTFTLILLDDFSRFVTGHAVSDAERAEVVIATFEAAVQRHGKPEAVMSDRGSAFWSWRGVSRFTALLEELGVDHYVAEDKEHNGKVEKFNADLAKEFFDVREYTDVSDMRQALAVHLRWHNHQRTHQALGGLLVPADRFYGREEEVLGLLARGGAGAGDPHALSLTGRAMDLFRVTSEDGQPQVWLMGRRIL